MPSLRELVKGSVSLTSLRSTTPESVALTTTNSADQLVGYFSGWTARLNVIDHGCKKPDGTALLVPMTVFTSSEEIVSCQWVKDQVQEYNNYDDVFEDSFLQSESMTLFVPKASQPP